MVSRSPGIRSTSAAIGTVLLLGAGTAALAEGLDTAEIQQYAYEPPSQHSMDFAPGAVGTPYALILRRVDGQLIANRWISAIIVTLANRLEGLDDGTPLPDNMMPPKPADP